MKTIFALLSSLLFLFSSAQPTFKKSFGSPDYGENYDGMAKLKSGAFIVAGSTDNFGTGGYEAYCIKLDAYGNTLWSKTYGDSSSNGSTKVAATADGGFVICFTSYKDKYVFGNTLNGLFVVKCNSEGGVQWCKSVQPRSPLIGKLHITPFQVYQSKGGDIYVLSDLNSADYYNANFSLLKLDAVGNFKWNTSVSLKISSYTQFGSVQVTEANNGDIIVGENAIGDDFYEFDDRVQISLFSQMTGENLANKIISQDYNNGFAYLRAYSLRVEGDELVVTGGYGHDKEGSGFCRFTLKPGDKQVTVYYNLSSDDPHNVGYLSIPLEQKLASVFNTTKDGGYLYAYNGFSPDYDIIVEKRDSLGRVCPDFSPLQPIDTAQQKQTIFNVVSHKNHILPLDVVGRDTTVRVTDVTAQKLLCEGSAPALAVNEKTSKTIVNLASGKAPMAYPNPATNLITISFETEQPGKVEIDVLTMDGRKIMTNNTAAGKGKQQVVLQVKGIAPGVYYIKINGLIGGIKLIKFVKE